MVALTQSSGGGSNPTTGIDDFSLTYTPSTAPAISAPASVTLASTSAGTASAVSTLNVSGANLTAPITVGFNPATTAFEVSSDNATWAATATLPAGGGPLYVRSAATAAEGSPNTATLTYTSGPASATTTLSGTVYPAGTGPCGPATAIATVRAGIPTQNSYTGPPATITGTVTATMGTSKFYVQDATGGMAVYMANAVTSLCLLYTSPSPRD